MNEELSSLQGILQQRQQQEFVGREEQISLFRENLFFKPDDDRRRFVLNIYGQGGIGKTSLLEQLFQLAKHLALAPAWTDEWQVDSLAVMVHLVAQLDPKHRFFKAFHRCFQDYRKLCQELEADPQAPKGSLAAFVRQTLIKATIRAGHPIPVGGAVMGLVDENNLAAKIEEAALYIARKLKNPDNRRLVQEPLAVLTPLFIQGLNKYTKGKSSPRLWRHFRRNIKSNSILIFFDTYERTGDFLDEWLRGIIAGRYGEVPSNIIFIISGRDELNRDLWIPYWDFVVPLNLEPFSEQELRLYLSHKGIVDQATVDVIFRLSGGLPLLVATLAAEHPSDPAKVGDPSGTAVDRFLKWIDDPVRRSAVVQTALPRYLNKDILKEVVGNQEVSTFFSWLIKRPFVKERGNAWRYHDVVRSLMLRWQRRESPEGWAEIHGRLADFYKKHVEDGATAGTDVLTDSTMRRFLVEEQYHRLCQSAQREMKAALDGFFTAFSLDESFAADLAEAVLQAGEDCNEEEVTQWGTYSQRE